MKPVVRRLLIIPPIVIGVFHRRARREIAGGARTARGFGTADTCACAARGEDRRRAAGDRVRRGDARPHLASGAGGLGPGRLQEPDTRSRRAPGGGCGADADRPAELRAGDPRDRSADRQDRGRPERARGARSEHREHPRDRAALARGLRARARAEAGAGRREHRHAERRRPRGEPLPPAARPGRRPGERTQAVPLRAQGPRSQPPRQRGQAGERQARPGAHDRRRAVQLAASRAPTSRSRSTSPSDSRWPRSTASTRSRSARTCRLPPCAT